MKPHISKRFENLGLSSFDLFAKAKELERKGISVIHLELGEPDFDTPNHIKRAVCEGLEKGYTHYTLPQGLPELRETISLYENHRKGIKANPENIVITPGLKPLLLYVFMAISNPGDEILIPDPGYMSYSSLVALAGAKPIPYPLEEKNMFKPDISGIKSLISSNTVALLINSPNNPTGTLIEKSDLEKLVELSEEYDIYLISDEIYSELVFEGKFHSLLNYWSADSKIIFLDGFSKTFAMTGWRLGYGILPNHLVKPVVKLITNSVSCATSFVQYAGIAALKGPKEPVLKMKETFKKRLELAVNLLSQSSKLEFVKPQGTFYIFPKYKGISKKSFELAMYILENHHVSVLPGIIFGENGEYHLRISFATSEELLEQGILRIIKAIDELSG